MTLKDLQQQVDEWIQTLGVRYFHQMTNMAILTEEVGELARVMSRRYGEQSWKTAVTKEVEKEQLADEMADILWVLTCLANQCDVDLSKAMERNLIKKTHRDAERHLNNDKLRDN